jgi:putative tricarboxylic transport membrane protein
MRKANFIVSGVFTALAVFIIVLSLTYPPSNHGVPGPGMFPIIIASLIILSSLSLFLTTFRMSKEADTSVDLKSKNVLNVYITMVGLMLYFILLPLVGFVVTSTVMLILYIKWFSKRPWWKTILISVIFVLAIFFLFGSVLNVPMRFGILI